jgi:hypothetical protein
MATQDPTLEALRQATARIEARLGRLEARSHRLRALLVGAGLLAGAVLAFTTARAEPAPPPAVARRARFTATTVPAVFHR